MMGAGGWQNNFFVRLQKSNKKSMFLDYFNTFEIQITFWWVHTWASTFNFASKKK